MALKQTDLKHFEEKLLERQRQYQEELKTLESEARSAGDPEVRDTADVAATAHATSLAFEESAVISETLEKIEAALQRIKDGTYGMCVLGDREIERARLEAIPWAEYCLADQEKLDRRNPQAYGGSTL
jgi:DnaK suppressor protein